MFKLVIQDDEGKTTVVPLIRDEITIGRKEGNTIRLTERNVSRRHARILRNNGEVQIEDLGSYNGIRVNNARIAERVNLRVSDQVQIGDYKLYLKAEGVEQVDDARTMPIERVDVSGGATEQIPAVGPAPTAPIAIPPTPAMGTAVGTTPPPPAAAPAAPQLIGNPNRTLVAMADTDPSTGRPLASPALIAAAIPQAAGFGKLVVLSSNFAGKEFELSRPQMIIGRTDENDLVINHRSISRNHAKVVREPNDSRYTISDLQSSNGVRVNGNDYSKVELRRGDVVDLGHVRLRFVEPGEDFVFARDAVITDVPETGGKKGLLVAILLGIAVLGGVLVYFLTRGGPDDNKGTGPGTGSSGIVAPAPDALDADGSQVAVVIPDASEVIPPPLTPDAGSATNVAATDAAKKLLEDCKQAQVDKKWSVLEDCGRALENAGGTGQEFIKRASEEARHEVSLRKLGEALKKPTPDIAEATRLVNTIPESSVYSKDARKQYNDIKRPLLQTAVAEMNKLTKDCAKWNDRARQLERMYGKGLADEARADAAKCQRDVAVVPPPKTTCDPACGDGFKCEGTRCVKKDENKPPPVTNICSDPALVADVETKGDAAMQNGSFAQALQNFEQIMRCKNVLTKVYLAACRARNFPKAKVYFNQLGKESYAQICMKEGYDPRK
ncbi:MAG: FHA domain-containing protein [Deltaproteobacteria bacterium]|nr:FHA domain-containing protein [Deltaproteobacteria bacterium]